MEIVRFSIGNVHIIRNNFGGRGGSAICYEALYG
jgi:hypothetical protein